MVDAVSNYLTCTMKLCSGHIRGHSREKHAWVIKRWTAAGPHPASGRIRLIQTVAPSRFSRGMAAVTHVVSLQRYPSAFVLTEEMTASRRPS